MTLQNSFINNFSKLKEWFNNREKSTQCKQGLKSCINKYKRKIVSIYNNNIYQCSIIPMDNFLWYTHRHHITCTTNHLIITHHSMIISLIKPRIESVNNHNKIYSQTTPWPIEKIPETILQNKDPQQIL